MSPSDGCGDGLVVEPGDCDRPLRDRCTAAALVAALVPKGADVLRPEEVETVPGPELKTG